MATSGRSENAWTVVGVKPAEKARIALACLRKAGITGERLLRIVLTIKAAAREIGPRGDPEFVTVQIARRAHRLIPGTYATTSGIPFRKAKHHRPSGLMLRILGRRIEDHAASGADHMAIQEVLDIKKRKESSRAL